MVTPRTQRRLAAILMADVVGYSRLMAADEAGSLATLTERRNAIIEPIVGNYGGRIVKLMGDGVLIEFASAVNAVEAAIKLQAAFAEANAPLAENRRMHLRIGINLGDVIGEGDDIFGDGVNIAARLEPLAEPGGICVSAKVRDEVCGKIDARLEDIGEQQLKNIASPVRAYVWRSGIHIPPAQPAAIMPSIAILPFANMSGDPQQQYFSDGITEDIITELARFRQLHVVARNSSFRYRGNDLDMVQAGRELGAHYLVEGSVRKIGPRLRITAQLIDAKSGHHLWADKFDRDEGEIFAVQDQVVRTIAGTLAGRLAAAGVELAKRKPPASLAAYDVVLRADALPMADPLAFMEARRLLEQAIALDPGYARAHALLAINYNIAWERTSDAPDSLLDRSFELAQRAVVLDDNDNVGHIALGLVALNRRNFELAEHHHRRALELNPNLPSLLASAGFLYSNLGEPEKGIAYFKEARIADPFFEPSWYWPAVGAAYYNARQYDEAIAALGHSQIKGWRQALLAACHAMTGRDAEARRHAAEALQHAPEFSIAAFMTKRSLRRAEDREHLIEGLRKAGLPE